MSLVTLGPFIFSSGWNPTDIRGPSRATYVIEHATPNSEGGITEYLGSQQSTYEIRGFIAPITGTRDGVAGAWLGTATYNGVIADDARTILLGLRSGAQLFRMESTLSPLSGLTVWYEQNFFFITNMTFAMEAGRSYPYYPYSINLRRAAIRTHGNSSGLTADYVSGGMYYSGYIRFWLLRNSGAPLGETLIGLGLYCTTAASGNAKMAVYDNTGGGTSATLLAQSPSQAVVSGWNYFPMRPTFTTTSGAFYNIGFKGDATNTSGFVVGYRSGGTADESNYSGTNYGDSFPTNTLDLSPAALAGVKNWATVMVA